MSTANNTDHRIAYATAIEKIDAVTASFCAAARTDAEAREHFKKIAALMPELDAAALTFERIEGAKAREAFFWTATNGGRS